MASTPVDYPPYPPVVASAPATVEDPTPYHRLFRTVPGYAWWRPLVAGVLFMVFAGVALIVVSVIWIVLAFLTGQITTDDVLSPGFEAQLLQSATDVANPLSLFLLLASLAVLLPLVPLAMLCVGLRPVGLRHSVTFRLRWGWMLRCAVPALVITAVSTLLPIVWELAAGNTVEPVPVDSGTFVLLAVMIVLLTPFQAAAEEYIFRGLIMQVIGAWVRWVPLAIIISTVLFTIGHTQYELWGALSVAVMGAGFAIVTWRTGGLEAAIVLHVINNLVALLLLASGVLGTTQMSSEGTGPLAPIIQAVFTAAYVFWVDRMAAKQGIDRARGLAAARV
jgi:membrane protease YdiL (CAAX protease family)